MDSKKNQFCLHWLVWVIRTSILQSWFNRVQTGRSLTVWNEQAYILQICVCVNGSICVKTDKNHFLTAPCFPIFLYLLSQCVALFLCSVSSSLNETKTQVTSKEILFLYPRGKLSNKTMLFGTHSIVVYTTELLSISSFKLCCVLDFKFTFTESLASEIGSNIFF